MRSRAKVCLGLAGLLALSMTAARAQTGSTELRYRVLIDEGGRPPVNGRLILYSGAWGWFDSVELARIEAGALEASVSESSFPEHWRFAAYQGYMLAILTEGGLVYPTELWISPHEPLDEVITRGVLLERLPELLAQLGRVVEVEGGKTLMLPRQAERRITLLHEDGKPLADETVAVDVYFWRQNHCGVAVGLGWGSRDNAAIGTFTTDATGSLRVIAPEASIVLRRSHSPIVDSGDGATLRQAADVVDVPNGSDVTIRSLWSNPSQSEAAIRVLSAAAEPISGWYAGWSMNTKTCGPPVQIAGPSDIEGWIRFAAPLPISLTGSMAIYDSDVRDGGPWDERLVHKLSREELLRFARDGSVALRLGKVAP